MNVLVIEDDQVTADFILRGLKQEGYTVTHAPNGHEGFIHLSEYHYDAAVVDIMMPVMDGLTLVDKLRSRKIMTPVLLLSARNSVGDRVRGLQAGGDDYMIKPFAFSELIARLQSLVRRSQTVTEPDQLRIGDLSMDLICRKVYRNGKEIILQPRELALLEYFMRHKGRIISKTLIMEHVWDYNFDPQTNVVESRVCKLRGKLKQPDSPELIHTVKGLGYICEVR
ncbi:MAG TPA: DNA-binding response regulator [Phycisphaerales bacterium]|nr:DNA-binding response regulator [Phycisphaerales bacterium]|tara:strand:+ start:315 stop:989 length:675 start_codon:yes stop_codon:yes gene_type:complete